MAYDAVQRQWTRRVIETSRARGQLLSLEDADIWESERFNLRKMEEAMVGRLNMRWIWDVDLPSELDKARAVFREKETSELGV